MEPPDCDGDAKGDALPEDAGEVDEPLFEDDEDGEEKGEFWAPGFAAAPAAGPDAGLLSDPGL